MAFAATPYVDGSPVSTPSAETRPAAGEVKMIHRSQCYGMTFEVFECRGERVAIVKRGGLLAVVAPLSRRGKRQTGGREHLLQLLAYLPRVQ